MQRPSSSGLATFWRREPDVRLRLPRPALCAALYAASIAILMTSPLGREWGYVDLHVYRYGGEAVLNGAHLYALRFPGALAFTYPPFSALAFTGLTIAPMRVNGPLFSAGIMLLLPLIFFLAMRLRPMRATLSRRQAISLALLASALGLWFEPVWTTLRCGQINLVIAALVLGDLGRRDDSRWKGVGIGLAIGLKLTPVIFAVYLLLTCRVRAAAVAAAAFLGTVALGFALVPGDSLEYWGGDFIDPSRVGRIENAANQTIRGALARLLHTLDVQTLWLCAAAVVALGGMALAIAAGRRGDEVRGFSLCALTGLLISPISWSHHWVLAMPALLLFAVEAHRRGSRRAMAAAATIAAIACSHIIWFVPVDEPLHSELHLDPRQLLYADAYVMLALIALAASAWSVLRLRRSFAPSGAFAAAPRSSLASRVPASWSLRGPVLPALAPRSTSRSRSTVKEVLPAADD
jgi:alpha-1,2-mannosyltransferase